VDKGYYDGVAVDKALNFEANLMSELKAAHQDLLDRVNQRGELSSDDDATLGKAIADFKASFV
jgi:F-type H+-transporting ATPase subunit alpha